LNNLRLVDPRYASVDPVVAPTPRSNPKSENGRGSWNPLASSGLHRLLQPDRGNRVAERSNGNTVPIPEVASSEVGTIDDPDNVLMTRSQHRYRCWPGMQLWV